MRYVFSGLLVLALVASILYFGYLMISDQIALNRNNRAVERADAEANASDSARKLVEAEQRVLELETSLALAEGRLAELQALIVEKKGNAAVNLVLAQAAAGAVKGNTRIVQGQFVGSEIQTLAFSGLINLGCAIGGAIMAYMAVKRKEANDDKT